MPETEHTGVSSSKHWWGFVHAESDSVWVDLVVDADVEALAQQGVDVLGPYDCDQEARDVVDKTVSLTQSRGET